jgi:C1q domain
MVADNSTLNVTVVRDNTSGTAGTNWTVDVTACNLSTDTSVKDFVITHNGTVINNTNYTKNSAVQITYTGAALVGSTTVVVKRFTPVTRLTQVVYGTKLSAANYEAEINRLHRVLAEFRLNGTLPEGLGTIDDTAFGVSWNGLTSTAASKNAIYDKIAVMISDTAYGVAWNGVTDVAPSQNAVYDRMALLATLASPTFTGTPNAPTPAQYTNTTQIATTAFVNKSQWPIVVLEALGLQSIPHNTTTTVQFNTETLDTSGAWNTTTHTFTAPVAGVYEFDATLWYTVGVTLNYIDIRVNNTTSYRLAALSTGADANLQVHGSMTLPLAINDTVQFQATHTNTGTAARTVANNTRPASHAHIKYLGVSA